MLLHSERRAVPRARYTGVAVAWTGGKELTCVAGNLSEGGMLLFPREIPKVKRGMPMRITFTLPAVEGWINAGAALQREDIVQDRYAWGIRFTDLEPEAARIVRDYVREAIAPRPQA